MTSGNDDEATSPRDRGDVCRPAVFAARAGAASGAQHPEPPPGGPVILSWSGGKDSAMALHRLRVDGRYQVVGLLTTISRQFRRISHHGVREELLERQADAIGLPLHRMYFGSEHGAPEQASMDAFERSMAELLEGFRSRGIHHMAYGDIYLADLRAYREARLASVGMRGVFPLWRRDTRELLHHFTRDGFRAVVTCAEPVAQSLCGVDLHSDLLANSWPYGVDPCGENGEFHSFVHAGPIFSKPLAFRRGETVVRDGRHYTDLIAERAADEPVAARAARKGEEAI